jgi:hypothetical protein
MLVEHVPCFWWCGMRAACQVDGSVGWPSPALAAGPHAVVLVAHPVLLVPASGIPVERMSEDEKDRLLNLGDNLKARVIGQDDAVDSLTAALCRARCV